MENNSLSKKEMRKLNRIKSRMERARKNNVPITTFFSINEKIIEQLRLEGYEVSYYFEQSRYATATLYIIAVNKK